MYFDDVYAQSKFDYIYLPVTVSEQCMDSITHLFRTYLQMFQNRILRLVTL
jgi:hypothetical protein